MPGGKKHKPGYTDSGVLHVQVASVPAPPPRPPPPPPASRAAAAAAATAVPEAALLPAAPAASAPVPALAPAPEVPAAEEDSAAGGASVQEGAKIGSARATAASEEDPSTPFDKRPPPSREVLEKGCKALGKLFADKHTFVSGTPLHLLRVLSTRGH